MTLEWTDLSFEQVNQSIAALIVFPVAALLVFLVLAALYESWVLPLAIVLIVPLCLLAALVGVWLTGGDNNIFVQVGLVVLMGLACKNAILIVEFARDLEQQGRSITQAALEARDRKSTRLNSSHVAISDAVFCLKKKKENGKAE